MSKYSRKAGEETPLPVPVDIERNIIAMEDFTPLPPLPPLPPPKSYIPRAERENRHQAKKLPPLNQGTSALYEMMQGNWDEMYAKYLKTNAWKVRRQEIIDRDICCRLCASEENLQVHHVDGAYKRIGNELDQDLTTLCRDCHEMYHSHKNSR